VRRHDRQPGACQLRHHQPGQCATSGQARVITKKSGYCILPHLKVESHVSSVKHVHDKCNHILLARLRLRVACRRLIQWALMLWPRG
jgi:hypothetical protein